MNKIYSALQLMRLYQLAQATEHISEHDLIEKSAQAFTTLFTEQYRGFARPVFIFAGYADNGAIALAVARLLKARRIAPEVYLFSNKGVLSEVCQVQRTRSEQAEVRVHYITNQFTAPTISEDALIIDGLFGSEATHGLDGGFVNLAQWINSLGRELVSIDLPSGILADGNIAAERSKAIRANKTITFESPRLAMLMSENAPYVGEWFVVSLGLSNSIKEQVSSTYYYHSEQSLASSLLRRDTFSHKSNYGKALIVGGDNGYYGQLILATKAAMTTGVGTVEVACPAQAHIPLILATPEAVLSDNRAHQHNLPSDLRSYKAIAIGTAMTSSFQEDELRNIFSSYRQPLVLDGTAIETISEHTALLDVIPEGSVLLLDDKTKKSLLGMQYRDIDFIEGAKQLSSRRNLTIVLKGTYNTICRASGNVYFNLKGNPGMASNGVGDVLTGLIVGFIARGYDTLTAVLIACYLHGTAGDYIAARISPESLTASSLIEQIPDILQMLYE